MDNLRLYTCALLHVLTASTSDFLSKLTKLAFLALQKLRLEWELWHQLAYPIEENRLTCTVCKFLEPQMSGKERKDIQVKAAQTLPVAPVRFLSMKKQARSGCVLCSLIDQGAELAIEHTQYIRQKDRRKIIVERTDAGFMIHERHNRMDPIVEFEIFCNPGESTPWKAIDDRIVLPPATSADECFEKIKSWMKKCKAEHIACGKRAQSGLPARVIDVGDDPDPSLRIYESSNEQKEYIALSHCWGNAAFPKTTRKKLEEYKVSISPDVLSKNFTDAVHITRKLGFRYLWIDAFNIVQDDEEDWARESAKMADIFGNAFLTIASVSSNNADTGCFHQRRSGRAIALRQIDGTWLYWRRALDHSFDDTLYGFKMLSMETSEYPLIQRKWCFQERILARRMVYFTSHEIVWECCEDTACECGKLPQLFRRSSEKRTHKIGYNQQMAMAKKSDLCLIWTRLIRDYSSRRLSFAGDMLPAFSGVASTFASPGLGQYFAGVWEHTLPRALCWCVQRHGGNKLYGTQIIRPKEVSVPSWSWASIRGAIEYTNNLERSAKDGTKKVEMIDVRCSTTTVDPFGRVGRSLLVIRSSSLETRIVSIDASIGVVMFERWDSPQSCIIDSDNDLDFLLGEHVSVMFVCRESEDSHFFALVLAETRDGFFRRVGCMRELHDPRDSSSDDVENGPLKTFHIV